MASNHHNEETGNGSDKVDLFVKNFGGRMDEESIASVFSRYGRVTKILIKPRGYAIVSYSTSEEARQAIKHLNGQLYKQKTLCVTYFQTRDERSVVLAGIHLMEGLNLSIHNLDKSVDEFQLLKMFEPFGNITSHTVIKRNGVSLGHGFVCFSKRDDAQKAMTLMNGRIIGSKPLSVQLSNKKQNEKGITLEIRTENFLKPGFLKSVFRDSGQILDIKVEQPSRYKDSYLSYITVSTREDADELEMRALHEIYCIDVRIVEDNEPTQEERNGRIRGESYSSTGSDDMGGEDAAPKRNLFVKNFHQNVTERDLGGFFLRFGTVKSVKIMMGRYGSYGFVCMSSSLEAQLAQEAMNGKACPMSERLFVSFHQTRSERNQFLHDQHLKRLSELALRDDNGEELGGQENQVPSQRPARAGAVSDDNVDQDRPKSMLRYSSQQRGQETDDDDDYEDDEEERCYQEGYNQHYNQGYNQGYNQHYNQHYNQRYNQGYN